MSSTRAAIRYAKAILEIADAKSVASEVSADMALIASTITSNSELSSFIQNPLIVTETKKDVVLEVFASVNGVTKSLFQLLLENKRFEILDGIAVEYNKLFDVMNGVEVAKVTTAIPMDAALEAKVSAKIASFSSSKKITIENTEMIPELIDVEFLKNNLNGTHFTFKLKEDSELKFEHVYLLSKSYDNINVYSQTSEFTPSLLRNFSAPVILKTEIEFLHHSQSE